MGNPSSLYSFGQAARGAITEARRTIARCLNCREDEVYVTSGGSGGGQLGDQNGRPHDGQKREKALDFHGV